VVPENIKHFIRGRQARSSYAKTYSAADPATGKEYSRVEIGLRADINQAVLAARAAFESGPWADMTALERADVLDRIADGIESRADEIADFEAIGAGLPVTQGREQTARAAEHFRVAAGAVRDSSVASADGREEFTLRRPLGVAGVIASWRTPFLGQARSLAPALATGCTVVLAVDVWTPPSGALLPEIATEAGVPTSVLNVVFGTGDWKGSGEVRTDTGDALIAHPSVPLVSFAGDAAAAERVTRDAATRGKQLSVGLIGNAPCVIFADADLEQAVDSALFGAFALNGGRRSATSRVLVERPVYEDIISRLSARADRIRVGSPADPSTEIGALLHYDRIMSQVRLGIREGARLAAGGRRPAGLAEGSYLAATVLADVTPEMRIFSELISAPVLCVTPFDTEEEAASLASVVAGAPATGAPAAYLWTSDPERAHRLAPAIDAAAIWVNSHNAQDLRTPAGGDGLDFYTKSRTLRVPLDDGPAPRFGD
jgi:5-carboxymethyl-2-hydroxymuconic-semialdehyde dehydrogenase